MEYEIACKYQEYESLQLVVAQAFGGEIEQKPDGPRSTIGAQPVSNMADMMSMVQSIGGTVGR